MSAIITDKFRILNTSNFANSVSDSSNSYYIFVGLPNPEASGFGRDPSWDLNPPNPTDNIDYLNHYKSTILFGKKISSSSITRVIRRINWVSGQIYEMYRPDYSGINSSPITGALRLYDANYYAMNSDYRIYICIDNGSSGSKPTGNASQIEPTFTDLEPVTLDDGYTWKYLYSINPSDIVKYDSSDYMPVPNDWSTSTNSQIQAVRENGDSSLNGNQIKQVYIQEGGVGYTAGTFACNIVGDGSGATASVTVDLDGKVSDVIVTSGGKNYTYAMVDLGTTSSKSTYAELIPIIPPSKGHGFDIYEELGADKLLIYARFDDSTKDFPVDTKFAQVGILKNPTIYDSTGVSTTKYTQSNFSAVYAMRLDPSSIVGETNISVGDKIKQSQTNGTAYGYVISYDKETKVLKYIKDRSLYYGNVGSSHQDYIGISSFFSTSTNSSLDFQPYPSNQVSNDLGFYGNIMNQNTSTVTISNKIIDLGVEFNSGLAKPEINNKSGEIIYIDDRSLVSRNSRQKEDIKIILEF